jgi:hypothetical protein
MSETTIPGRERTVSQAGIQHHPHGGMAALFIWVGCWLIHFLFPSFSYLDVSSVLCFFSTTDGYSVSGKNSLPQWNLSVILMFEQSKSRRKGLEESSRDGLRTSL